MSEYQYYEFQAIDRPLTQSQMKELRSYSSRAQITPTSFVNVYNWGDFKGDPKKWMEKYFDAFLYVSNWGVRQLMFRIPKQLLDLETVSMYCDDDCLSCRHKGDYAILSFFLEQDDGDWEEDGGDDWLASLISLRSDLMRGDYRSLYLGWLAAVNADQFDDDAMEPSVPSGLGQLTAPLQSLADFLCIDSDLLCTAAIESKPGQNYVLTDEEIADWVNRMSSKEKDAVIAALLGDDNPHVVIEFKQRSIRELLNARSAARNLCGEERRTIGQLMARAETIADERRRKAAEKKAQEKAKREQEQAEQRKKYLESLIGKDEALWSKVAALIATKQPRQYDEAVSLLQDFRDLADMTDQARTFTARMNALRSEHAKKPSLLSRFQKAGLTGEEKA